MKTIGLVGGISWASTAEYYKYINELTNEKLGGMNFARCLIHSLNFNDIIELSKKNDWDTAGEIFVDAAKKLTAAGADCVLLCANTAHIRAEKVQAAIFVPLIHIAEVCADEIRRQGISCVSLLGTKFTMENDFFKKKLTDKGIKAIIPEEEDRAFIHASIFDELGKGIIKDETRERYKYIINKLGTAGAEGSILGCTEIPLLIKFGDVNYPVFDTTWLHAKAAVDFALG